MTFSKILRSLFRLHRLATAAVISAGLSLPQLAAAQDSGTPGTDAESGQIELDMGTPVEEEADGIGEPYILELSGDWAVSCIRTVLEHDPCGLVQELSDQNGNAVARVRLVNIPGGGQAAAGANIVTPLETLLSRQISLSVDGSPERQYGFTYCTQVSCVANVGFTDIEVDQFRRGNSARMTIFALQAPDQPVTLNISLTGFTRGFARVAELNALNAESVAAARAAQEGAASPE